MTRLSIFQFSFGDGYAGSARVALQSTELLSKKGHNVILFVSKNSLTEKRGLEAGLTIIPYDTSIPFKGLKHQIFNDYIKHKPEIIIGHHSLDRKIGISIKRKFGREVFNIAYRHNVSKSVPVIGSFIYNLYSDRLIACSRGVKESLVSSGIKENKVEVIYNGISIPSGLNSIHGEEVKKKFSIQNKKVLGLSTWFHKERKGFDILFKAFSRLNSDHILFLVGVTGNDRQAVINYASGFGISENRLILPGYVDNIWEYYKAMDIFLLPSRSEGFSLALLEAAAAQVPIIASNIPGNNEFIKNGVNGILFNTEKPEELASGVERLFNDKRMAAVFSNCAYRHVMSNYTIERYADRLEEFLIAVCGLQNDL
jgi:glycosyltransferase involved in cell wall biosynthesis